MLFISFHISESKILTDVTDYCRFPCDCLTACGKVFLWKYANISLFRLIFTIILFFLAYRFNCNTFNTFFSKNCSRLCYTCTRVLVCRHFHSLHVFLLQRRSLHPKRLVRCESPVDVHQPANRQNIGEQDARHKNRFGRPQIQSFRSLLSRFTKWPRWRKVV